MGEVEELEELIGGGGGAGGAEWRRWVQELEEAEELKELKVFFRRLTVNMLRLPTTQNSRLPASNSVTKPPSIMFRLPGCAGCQHQDCAPLDLLKRWEKWLQAQPTVGV